MSRKKLLASSLTICSASTTWVMNTDAHPVYVEELKRNPSLDQAVVAQEALVQYLNPITTVADGNLAEKVETKPITYHLKKGDTLYGISQLFGVDVDELTRYNHIASPDQVDVGRRINIPLSKKWVRVKMGETLTSIAEKHQMIEDLILYLNPDLQETKGAYVGQLIAVPQRLTKSKPVVKQNQEKKLKVLPVADHKEEASQSPVLEKKGAYIFHWPVIGQITSHFGRRWGRQHKGIDIWSAARSKAPIRAALEGVVTRCGYSGNFGNLVVVDHGKGWQTYYAHLSQIRVSKGQKVSIGQLLGYMGQTGRATGYHLHFEVHKQGQAIDPLSVLNHR
jgi:murein DD-endopeptidase MepM/ murein hydrolase activator NlpD